MLSQQSTIFPKQIKIDDYQSSENNHLILLQSSNLLLGSGSRTSTAAIVLVKALQNMADQGDIKFQGKSILDLGCGVGLVGLFLSVLGAKVGLCDTPAIKDLVQRNIKINRQMLKGKAQFFVASWQTFQQQRRKINCIGDCKQSLESQTVSTSSSSKTKQSCLFHLVKEFDLTIVCQCGGMNELQNQLHFMGKEGMILAFMRRQNWEDGLDKRTVEEYLNEKSYQYEIIDSYHPDYVDNRVIIFRIYPSIITKQEGEEMVQKETQKAINQQVNKLTI